MRLRVIGCDHSRCIPGQCGREGTASRYKSEGEKAGHDASLHTDLCGAGRRHAGLGCLKPGRLGPVPISVPQHRLGISAGALTISVNLVLSWG